ncbi:hypothetical protein AX774_g6020, partial [Zancudomyces culisetae]
ENLPSFFKLVNTIPSRDFDKENIINELKKHTDNDELKEQPELTQKDDIKNTSLSHDKKGIKRSADELSTGVGASYDVNTESEYRSKKHERDLENTAQSKKIEFFDAVLQHGKRQKKFWKVVDFNEENANTNAESDEDSEVDESMKTLMSMLREHLSVTQGSNYTVGNKTVSGGDGEDEYVYDLYYGTSLANSEDPEIFTSSKLATLYWEAGGAVFLDEGGTDSDFDSEDSNDENYYTNEYPDEPGISDREYNTDSEYENGYSDDSEYEEYY